MNRQVNPDHCYETRGRRPLHARNRSAHGTRRVACRSRTGASIRPLSTRVMAAKGWLEHVLEATDERARQRMDRERLGVPSKGATSDQRPKNRRSHRSKSCAAKFARSLSRACVN